MYHDGKRMPKCWLYLFVSAITFQCAFFSPRFFFWLVFVWLIPLFFCIQKGFKLSFKEGFLWGIIFYSFHLLSVTKLLMTESYGAGRFLFPLLLIGYCATHSGIWFFFADKTAALLGANRIAQAIAWQGWTVIYLLWVPRGLLWISGQYVGYPLCFPLLPLAHYPHFLYLLASLSRELLVFCVVFFSMTLSLLKKEGYYPVLFISSLSLAPFFLGFLQTKEITIPPISNTLGYIEPPDPEVFCHPMDAAQEIYYRMQDLIERYPEIKYIVMPELSYRFTLNKHKHIIDLWNNNVLHNSVDLFIGACREDKKGRVFNSLYWIKEGKIKKVYDKKNLMPFAEYTPKFFEKVPFFSDLFFKKSRAFSAMRKKGVVFDISNNFFFEPFICSEIFFDVSRDIKMSDNSFFLTILNDSLFSSYSFRHLMFLWHHFKVLEQNKACLFVGYNYAALLGSSYSYVIS